MEQTKTKKALIMSVLSMVLCIAMLIGMTFAWFTDTASTGVNKIQAGNLNVELEMYKDSRYVNISKNPAPIFGSETSSVAQNNNLDTLWEPGKTQIAYLAIKNEGNLALKYKVALNVTNPDDGKDLYKVMEYAITPDAKGGETAPAWTSGKSVGTGTQLVSENEVSLAAGATHYFALLVHMDEQAGNEYQGGKVDFDLSVLATQDNVENDSYGPNYDEDAPLDFVPVSNAAELKTVFANATAGEDVNVSLTGDIDLGADNTLMIVDENSNIGDINIQANGHTVKNAVAGARVLQIAKSDAARTITISNAKIVSEGAVTSNENRGVQIFSVDNATVNLVNCDIEMKANDYSYPVKIGGTSKNTTVNITGCTLTGANCIESFGTNCTVNITDCVLNSNYAANATYCGNGIQDKNGTNNTYNIKNTTFNGTNAQRWQTNSTTVINDLGGNVYNTTRTTE